MSEKVVLCRWATLVSSSSGKKKKISRKKKKIKTTSVKKEAATLMTLEEEEAFLRTRCFHILSKKIDSILGQAIETNSSLLIQELNFFFDKSIQNKAVDNRFSSSSPIRKRPRIATTATTTDASNSRHEDSNSKDETLRETCSALIQPTYVNPKLLPIALLEGPSFSLDRHEMMKALFMSVRHLRKRSAVVWLQKANRHSMSWMEDLVHQCINQESHILASTKIRQKIRKKGLSLSDKLILWASHSIAFDDIVVFLEVEDIFYGPELQDFLCLLALTRSQHGLPLNVILLCPHEGRRALDFRSWTQGSCGFFTQTFTLPSCQQIFESFWRNFLIAELPILFPTSVLLAIRHSYNKQKSSIRAILKLKQALAHAFVSTGSFLSVAWEKHILDQEAPRIAWFCLNREARNLILGERANSSQICLYDGPSVLRLIDDMELRSKKITTLLNVLLESAKAVEGSDEILSFSIQRDHDSNFEYADGFSGGSGKIHRLLKSRIEILEILVRLRAKSNHEALDGKITEHNNDKGDKQLKRCVNPFALAESPRSSEQEKTPIDLLNELIILYGRCDDLQLVEKGLVSMLDQWILDTEKKAKNTSSQNDRQDQTTSKFGELKWNAVIGSFSPEPRRDVVGGLSKNVDGSGSSPISLANIAGILYYLINDRVSIGREEWFAELWEIANDKTISRLDVFSLFACGLRYLKVCGLISEKRVGSSNRGCVFYEKTKLVWCSGDF